MFLVAVLAAGVGVIQKVQYQSGATIWVDQPQVLDPGYTPTPDKTVAETQLANFEQLLETEVIQSSIVAEIKKDHPNLGAKWNFGSLGKTFKFVAAGPNIIDLTTTGDSPEMARDVAAAFVDVLQTRYFADLQTQSNATLKYYQGRLDTITSQQDSINQSMTNYLNQHPQLRENPGIATIEPEMVRMRQQNDYYQTQADLYRSKMEQIRQAVTLGTETNAFFHLIDVPTAPEPKSQAGKILQIIIFGVLGLVAGLILGMVYIIITTIFSKSFFRTRELALATGLPTYRMAYQKPPKPAKEVKEKKTTPKPAKKVEPLKTGSIQAAKPAEPVEVSELRPAPIQTTEPVQSSKSTETTEAEKAEKQEELVKN